MKRLLFLCITLLLFSATGLQAQKRYITADELTIKATDGVANVTIQGGDLTITKFGHDGVNTYIIVVDTLGRMDTLNLSDLPGATGATGPTGPTGAQGPTGPAAPAYRLDLETDSLFLTEDGTPVDTVVFVNSTAIGVACSDLTTPLTTGTGKAYFRMPYNMVVDSVRASLYTAPFGGLLTADINENGTSILSSKITIDTGEKTSRTATTPPVVSDVELLNDAEITIDIDTADGTSSGLVIWIFGKK